MTPHTQRVVACPIRNDGHDADGNPGDCLRTAIASMFDLDPEQVPHFAMHLNWWDSLRRWADERHADFACIHVEPGTDLSAYATGLPLIGSGPSPRGPFWHVVLADTDLNLVHDPDPSPAGLVDASQVVVYCRPYFPRPRQLALESA